MPAPRTGQSLALAVLAALAAGCPKKDNNAQDPNVVAVVNGEVISRTDFERELLRELQSSAGASPTPEQIEPVKRALVDTLVERTLLLQHARALNVVVTPEELDRGLLRITSDYPAEGLADALTQGQLSAAELKQKTLAQLTVEKLFQEHVYSRVGVTEEEIRKYFDEHRDDFLEPEQVRAAQIVVKGIDDARRIQQQLRAGKKFADLARRYSLSADAKVGGDLGYFARGVMPREFDEVAFKLGVGEVSDVVTSDYGFHLIKVLDRKPPRRRDLSEVRRQIEQKLVKQRQEAAQREFVEALRAKAKLQINDQTLLAVAARVHAGKAATAE